MTSIGTFLRTVRHLRPGQIVGRLRLRFRRQRPDFREAPRQRTRCGDWVVPAARAPSLTRASCLRLLNVDYDIDQQGWDDPSTDRLLRYNLHYFDDLNARDARTRAAWQRALGDGWVQANEPGRGTGWEPYPLSIRVVNWIKWFAGGAPPEPVWLHSLAIQARWLRGRLETHLMGNHLFINAKALIYLGLFFEGAEADAWADCGVQILKEELPEQILHDGGHFERSPMYHALALEDVLDLLNLIGAFAPVDSSARELEPMLRSKAGPMLHWLRCMSHGDGGLGFFNDCAQGIAPPLSELERYAAELEIVAPQPATDAVTHLADSGYVRVSRGSVLALLDVAPLGPDYLPAHAHADTLSFELSLGLQRVIVNGGTSCYGTSAQRLHERSTAAHSTLNIGGYDSSEVWSGFRVGRRARPTAAAINGWEVSSSHDGYRFLPGKPQHRRSWRLGDRELLVEDHVTPAGQDAAARYILAPALRLEPFSHNRWRVLRQNESIATVDVLAGEARSARATHAPEFGVLLSVDCLDVSLTDGCSRTRWSFTDATRSLPARA